MYPFNKNSKAALEGDLNELPNAINIMLKTAHKHAIHVATRKGAVDRVQHILQRSLYGYGGDEAYPLALLDPKIKQYLFDELTKGGLLTSNEGTRVSNDGTKHHIDTIKKDIEETIRMLNDPTELRLQVMIKKIRLQEELDKDNLRESFLAPTSLLNKKLEQMKNKIDAVKKKRDTLVAKGLGIDVTTLNGTIAAIEGKKYEQFVADHALTFNRIDACIQVVDNELKRVSQAGVSDAQKQTAYREMINGSGLNITGPGLDKATTQLLGTNKATMLVIKNKMPADIDLDIRNLEHQLQIFEKAVKDEEDKRKAPPPTGTGGPTPTPPRPLNEDERREAYTEFWKKNRRANPSWKLGSNAPDNWEPEPDVADEIRKGTWRPHP